MGDENGADVAVPQVPDPENERDTVLAKAREYLNDRSRVIAAGVLAVVWGLLVAEPKLALEVTPSARTIFAGAAILSLAALLFDFLEYLAEYLDAKTFAGALFGPGGRLMFVGKQTLALLAAAILVATVVVLFFRGTNSQASEVWRLYEGAVWNNPDRSDQRASKLIVSQVNPVTSEVTGREDGTPCQGVQQALSLVLLCPPAGKDPQTEHIRFDGTLANNKYEGEWTPISASSKKGFFSYKFKKVWSKP